MEILEAFWRQSNETSHKGLQGYLDHLIIDSRPPARLKKLLQANPWEEELLKLLIPLFETAAGFSETEKRCAYITAPRGHCLAGESLIFDPLLGDYRRLDGIDSGFHVWARTATGERVIAPALPPFLKGVEDLYEITLSNGLKFRSTLGHRVLSSSSWQQIRACVDSPLLSSQDTALSVRKPGVRHSSERALNYQRYCCQDYSQCDAQLPLLLSIDPSAFPLRVDALEHNHHQRRHQWDGLDSEYKHTLVYQCSYPLSKKHCVPCWLYRHDEECSCEKINFLPYPLTGDIHCLNAQANKTAIHQTINERQLLSEYTRSHTIRPFAPAAKEHACDKDSSYVYITNIKYLRKDRYYDFTVPVHHNYEMAGVWHHNSKTSMLAMLCNWALVYARHTISIVAAAADRDQAQILISRCKAEAINNPWLKSQLDVKHYDVVGPKGVLNALSADAPTSSGLLADLYIVDELSMHPKRDLFDILYSGKDKRPTGCFVIISNAGEKGSWQHDLWEAAKKSPRWLCHEVPPMSASWLDKDLIEDQRQTLPLSLFRRLHQNIWTTPGADNAFVTKEQLIPCITGQECLYNREHSHVISIDYGMTQDRTALCVCHADDNSNVVLDTMSCWQGNQQSHVQIDRIEEWITEQMQNFRISKIVLDAFQLEGTAQKFEPYVNVERVNFGGNMLTKLAENLRSLVLGQRIKLYPQAGLLPVKNRMEDLVDELLELQIVQKGNLWTWQHSVTGHDDRTAVLSMAALSIVKERPNLPEVIILSDLPGESDLPQEEDIIWKKPGLELTCWH